MTAYDDYRIARDGQLLGALSPAIRVVDVVEQAATYAIQTVQRAGAPGSFVTRSRRTSLAVRIQLAVLEDDYTLRTAILDRIRAWAHLGTYLTLGDRPAQRLACLCTSPPMAQSKRKWTGLCEMTFTAYRVPFWEDVHPVSAVSADRAEAHSLALAVPGTAETPLRGTITAAGAVDSVTLAVNGQEMAFSGLGLTEGQQLVLRSEGGLLDAHTLREGVSTPCLHLRTGESADDLLLPAQSCCTVSITADGPVTAVMHARGRYE